MKKLVSTLLALSIILGTLFTGMSLGVSASTITDAVPVVDKGEKISYPISSYGAEYNMQRHNVRGYHLPSYDKASIALCGVDGSYALKIEGEGKDIESYIQIGTAAEVLTKGTEYIVELDIKGSVNFEDYEYDDGTPPYVSLGVYTNFDNDFTLTEVTPYYPTEEFTTVSHTFTSAGGWAHIKLAYSIPVGEEIYIDNIKIYKASATDVNIFNTSNAENGRNFGSFDWYSAATVEDTVDSDVEYIPISALKNTWISGETQKNLSYVTVASGKGVNGSSALQIAGIGEWEHPYYKFAEESEQYGTGTNFFGSVKTLRIAFKAKKVGTVTSAFYFSFNNITKGNKYRLLKVSLTDDWVRYETEITFTSSESSANASGHKGLYIECNVPKGSYIYIDDIEIYGSDDGFTQNRYNIDGYGTFDSYSKKAVTETAYEGVTYEPYSLSTYFTSDDGYSNIYNSALKPSDSAIAFSGNEGVNSSSALTVTGEGADKEFSLHMGQYVFKNNTNYLMKFKAKVSEDATLSKFNMVLQDKWNFYSAATNTTNGLNLSNEEGIYEIGTDWQEYSVLVKSNGDVNGNGAYVNLYYNLSQDAKLYIDDVEFYEVGGNGKNKFPKGAFGYVSAVEEIETEEVGAFQYKSATNPDNVGAFATSLALSGDHVLKLGLNPDALSNCYVQIEIPRISTGKTYKVDLSVLYVGNVTLDMYMTDGSGAFATCINVTDYKRERWQNYEFYFTDDYDGTSTYYFPTMVFDVYAGAGSGVLIDNVSVCEVSDNYAETPNLFKNSGFEKRVIADADFSSDKFWSNESATDMSFMSELPKSIGFINGNYTSNPDIFNDILLADSDFAYGDTVIIDATNLTTAEFEAKLARDAGKEIWLDISYLVSGGEVGSKALISSYKTYLNDIANLIQSIAPDNFQGFYIDEPHDKFASNDEFKELTQYCRETFKKRVFALLKHDSFHNDTKVYVDVDAFAYVTDIGYWNYTLDGIEDRINGFNTALASVNENARVWFVPLMGKFSSMDTEEENIEIFNKMLAGVKDNQNFGGILLYSLTDTNGYKLHKLNENGEAEYNNYRNLLLAVDAEFAGETVSANDVFATELNVDGVLIVDGSSAAGVYVNGAYADNVTAFDGESAIGTNDAIAKTGITVKVSCLTNTEIIEVKTALLNDLNGDGNTNVIDLVRMKKIAVDGNAPAEQFAAAGSTKSDGISAIHLTNLIKVLIG